MVRPLEVLISTSALCHFANGSGNSSSSNSYPSNYFPALCAGPYFEMTVANREQSQSAAFYGKWEYNAFTNDTEKYREKGETSLFAFQHLKDVDLSYNDKMDLARKVYFSIKDIESIASALASIDNALQVVRNYMQGRAGKVINDATIQSNKEGELICDITRFAVDFAVNFALTAAPSSAGESYVTLAWKTTKASLDTADKGLDYTSFHIRNSPSFPDFGHDVPQSVCNGLGGVIKDKNLDKTTAVLKHLDSVFGKIRTHLSKVSLVLMQGAFAAEENKLDPFVRMATWMKEGQRKDAVELIKNYNRQQHEQLAEKQFLGYITPAVMWSSACYVKCATGLNSKRLCTEKGPHQDERYCPDDLTTCQEQCWTNTKYNNYEITLHGKDKLADYGLSPQEVAESSYENFIANRFHFNNTQLSDDLFFNDNSANTISLPVCMSKSTKVTDFEPEDTHLDLKIGGLKILQFLKIHKLGQFFDYHPNLNTQFPCACGNWMSNETRLFMDQIGMGSGPEGRIGATKQTFTEICPRNLEGMWPLNRYLAFCELDIHWPFIGELFAIQPGSHAQLCEKVKQHIISEKLEEDEAQANWRFCSRRWLETAEILDRELNSAFMVWGKWVHGHEYHCEQFREWHQMPPSLEHIYDE